MAETPGNRRCKGHDGKCSIRMTWAQERVQLGRLVRAGLNWGEAKEVLPRCQKCVTIWLEDLNAVRQHSNTSHSTH